MRTPARIPPDECDIAGAATASQLPAGRRNRATWQAERTRIIPEISKSAPISCHKALIV